MNPFHEQNLEPKSICFDALWRIVTQRKGSGIPAEMPLKLVDVYSISAAVAYEHLMKFHQYQTREKNE